MIILAQGQSLRQELSTGGSVKSKDKRKNVWDNIFIQSL